MSQASAALSAMPDAHQWKPYSVYKDSGVDWLGEIPAEWHVQRLRFACQVNPSKAEIAGLPPETSVTFLPMERIGEDGTLHLSETRTIEQVRQGFTYFSDGDVIVAKITPCFENGKAALCMGLLNGIGFGTTELHILRPHTNIDPKFLFYVITSEPFRRLGTAAMYGAAGQQRVPESFIKDFTLGVAPLGEQQRIAAFLDRETARIDALVAKKQRLIALLQEKRTALITQAVTRGLDPAAPLRDSGVAWLGAVPAHWDVAPVYARYSVQLGKMLNAEAVKGAYPASYLRNTNIQWDRVDLTDVYEMDFDPIERRKFALLPGDLLVCEGGEVGRSALWHGELEECYFQKAVHRLRPKSDTEEPRFLYYILYAASQLRVFEIEGNRSTIVHLTAEKLRKHRFGFPSLDEQRMISSYLDRETNRIDRLIRKIQQHLQKLQEYRTALISAAVTGQIDVRGARAM